MKPRAMIKNSIHNAINKDVNNKKVWETNQGDPKRVKTVMYFNAPWQGSIKKPPGYHGYY